MVIVSELLPLPKQMLEREIIQKARRQFETEHQPIQTLEDALEAFYMSGSADEVSGNVDAPTGHFYRIDRWIVSTDEREFRDIKSFANVKAAEEAFSELEDEYDEWMEQ